MRTYLDLCCKCSHKKKAVQEIVPLFSYFGTIIVYYYSVF